MVSSLLLSDAAEAGHSGNLSSGPANVARRYRTGDLSARLRRRSAGHGGSGADDSVHVLGRRIADLARDRARMKAILAGMIEGVTVVDRQGTLQFANGAARPMLRLDELANGRQYVKTIRHPAHHAAGVATACPPEHAVARGCSAAPSVHAHDDARMADRADPVFPGTSS